MKLLILAALVAVASTGRLSHQDNVQSQYLSPWQVGKLYRYDVESHVLASLQEGTTSGTAFKARFIIRVKAPGQLQARLENPQHAQIHQELANNMEIPQDLKYEPVMKMDQPFEIKLNGGRVQSLNLPSSLSLPQENMLKGLISALQVDLSTHRTVSHMQNHYDQVTRQGLFRKMETDVTGDCETLYSVAPAASEWRREIPIFSSMEEPIEITKSKNYAHCHHRIDYHFGVPQGAEWTGTAHDPKEQQFIRRSTVVRMLAGAQGPIYKTETTGDVHVHPYLFGKQKAEVHSYVKLYLVSYEEDKEEQWQKPESNRLIHSLLYSMTTKNVVSHDQSSSSSSSSESHEHQYPQVANARNIVRRSVQSPEPELNNQQQWQKWESSSSVSASSSSSSDSSSAYINDEIPNFGEPAYASLYMTAQPRSDKKQNAMNAQKLVQELAQQLQNSNNMPKADFLSKFNILVRVIASMSYEQLNQVSRSIEIAKSSNNIVKANMWMIYRDAVAQAGTLPAFQQIKSWILSKKIQEEEAAQVVSTLANTLRYPTKELMIQFFELAMNPEVQQQMFLNSSALIAATRFINMGHVNNETAHSYYPSHMYGRLARKHDRFVPEVVLPRLSKMLREAIQNGDSSNAQVYIRAIGNLGHRDILQVYAPYLEGQVSVSSYLRVQMVNSLQTLAYQRDKYVRAVLYSIVRNTAEEYEVRVAAIHNIFMTNPTTAMMQAMAQMTHNDPSVQVRAVIKSAIESAAELKNPRYLDLARTAQAAKWLLTKETFGQQYSMKYLLSSYADEYEYGIISSLSHTGSEDNLFPKYLRYTLKSNVGGWDKQNTISASFSSVQQFVDYIMQKANPQQQSQASAPNHKYSANKIAEMLNIQRDQQRPLEAAFYFELMNQQRQFTFDRNDLNKLPEIISEFNKNLAQGYNKQYTKVFNQAQVTIMFPLAVGMPFIYKYKEPTVIYMQTKVKGQVQPTLKDDSQYWANIENEMQVTYAKNIHGSVGFMDTLANHYHRAGVMNKLQVTVPLKLHLQLKSGEWKIQAQPLRPDQDTNIVHYSVWPYTSIQNKDSLMPISLDPSTKIVSRKNKVVSIDTKFGQSIGNVFHLQGYSHSNDYKGLGSLFQQGDLLANIWNVLRQKDVAITHFNLKYLGKQSQNKVVTLTAKYDTLYNQKQGGEPSPVQWTMQDLQDSIVRRKELTKRVTVGINTAKAQVVDFDVNFQGPQKIQYVFTAAMANSHVDPKIQYAFFGGKNSQQGNGHISGYSTVNLPEVVSMNFPQAIAKEMKMNFNADIVFGQNGNIHIQGSTQRTKQYTEALQKLPLVQQCTQEIALNNYYQPACHKLIVEAHLPDLFKASVTYKDVSPVVRNMFYQLYRLVDYYGYWYSDKNIQKSTTEGKLDAEVEINYLERYLNFVLNSRLGELRMKNVPIPKMTPGIFAVYYPFTASDRIFNYYLGHQYQPYCTVDGSRIKTFSNRVYDYTLSRSWHVVMQEQYPQALNQQGEQLVILARKPTENQQEIYVSYWSETGKDLEINIQPAQSGNKYIVNVKSNANKVSEGDLTMYWDEVEQMPLLEYYTQPDGVLMLNIRDHLRSMYDGQRFVILSSENRNITRGICGYKNGEPRYDYLIPQGQVVDKAEHFGASFALKEENSDPQTQQLQMEAQQQAYQPEIKHTMILRADNEWQKEHQQQWYEQQSSHNVYRTRSYQKQREGCQVQQQVQYYENHGEICITTSPLPACQSHCAGEGYRQQAAQVVCRPKIDGEFQSYKEQILQGNNPQISGVPQAKQFRVPTSCRA